MSSDWYRVHLSGKTHIDYVEIHEWCLKNCQGNFVRFPIWYSYGYEFKNEKDAVMFALRWA